MNTRLYLPMTPGTRNRSVSSFKECTSRKPPKQKALTLSLKKKSGRNNSGHITSRHRGGGHKKLYRQIDFKRTKMNIPAVVASVEYDPNRNARIALLHYEDGDKRYILQPQGLEIGDKLLTSPSAPRSIGNALPLRNMPLGAQIHNLEIHPRLAYLPTESRNGNINSDIPVLGSKGGQLVRSAGTVAQILAKEGNFVTVRLPSGEVRLFSEKCWATLGSVGNSQAFTVRLGKAGRKRWLGKRPHVRGSAMNACDHAHGGGEGRAPIGRKRPSTPWGKPALGKKTRSPKKYSQTLIIRRRTSS